MNVELVWRGIAASEEARGYVDRRLRFALGRFAPMVSGVTVVLADENGPRGGIDQRCTLRVRLKGLPELIVEQKGEEWRSNFDRAADRMTRLAARAVKRRSHDARHSPNRMVLGSSGPVGVELDGILQRLVVPASQVG